ncbi:MAG: hypothetical protein CME65_02380 [Halobacteriovoraceae bacterium]|nr:hypothetical protein [Halobacteriovoraceae bacterium]|tara:strand:- start:12059 stop:13003 length:945 start_codon:yes stop_codon:yes gene_type:complete
MAHIAKNFFLSHISEHYSYPNSKVLFSPNYVEENPEDIFIISKYAKNFSDYLQDFHSSNLNDFWEVNLTGPKTIVFTCSYLIENLSLQFWANIFSKQNDLVYQIYTAYQKLWLTKSMRLMHENSHLKQNFISIPFQTRLTKERLQNTPKIPIIQSLSPKDLNLDLRIANFLSPSVSLGQDTYLLDQFRHIAETSLFKILEEVRETILDNYFQLQQHSLLRQYINFENFSLFLPQKNRTLEEILKIISLQEIKRIIKILEDELGKSFYECFEMIDILEKNQIETWMRQQNSYGFPLNFFDDSCDNLRLVMEAVSQ